MESRFQGCGNSRDSYFKNCYYICPLPLFRLFISHLWILRDNEPWFCAFNPLSAPWRIIKAHRDDGYIQFTYRNSLVYGGFWFSNHKCLLLWIICDSLYLKKKNLLKNSSKLLKIFYLPNVSDLGTVKMDKLHSYKYTLICHTMIIEDIKEFGWSQDADDMCWW